MMNFTGLDPSVYLEVVGTRITKTLATLRRNIIQECTARSQCSSGFAGPVSSMLVNRFGSRPVVIMGGLMCGVSMVTASFGSSIAYLYFCIGVIGGTVLLFLSSIVLLLLEQVLLFVVSLWEFIIDHRLKPRYHAILVYHSVCIPINPGPSGIGMLAVCIFSHPF